MDPRYVVVLGTSSSGTTVPVALTLDQGKALEVTSPNWFVDDAGAGLQNASEAQAYLVNVLEPFFLFVSNKPPGLLTASMMYSQGASSGDLVGLTGQDTTVDGVSGNDNGTAAGDGSSILVFSQEYAWNGAAYDRVRVANVFHTAFVTGAGTTAVWTPTAGTSFRLMGYSIDIAGTAAATSVQHVELLDGATVIKNHCATVLQTFAATTALTGANISVDLGQGQLSAAANNVLNVNLSEAMASGGVAINVWGTEE